jgi:hypothetical protein
MGKRKPAQPAQMHDAGDRIVMDISIEEAMTLELLMSFVGGCSSKSPRKHADSIMEALRSLGIGHSITDTPKVLSDERGVYFKNVDIKKYSKWKPK